MRIAQLSWSKLYLLKLFSKSRITFTPQPHLSSPSFPFPSVYLHPDTLAQSGMTRYETTQNTVGKPKRRISLNKMCRCYMALFLLAHSFQCIVRIHLLLSFVSTTFFPETDLVINTVFLLEGLGNITFCINCVMLWPTQSEHQVLKKVKSHQ